MENNLRITQLKLSNYRNHKFLQINPTKNIILISGKNGAGKTNVLESISLFDSNTGFRNAKLSELIRYDLIGPKELFGVNLKVYTDNKNFDVGFGLKGELNLVKKVISIDKRKTSLRSFFNIFWVLPQMSHLLQGKPEDRRGFLDLMVSATDVSYKKKLLDYKKLKNERLRILKNLEISKNDKWLDVIEKKMSEVGVVICDSRRIFLDTLNKCFIKIDDQIPMLNLKLNGTADRMLLEKPALFVEELIVRELKKNRLKDSISGRTNFSVNKTDLLVYEKKSNKEGKNFSTGEQKIIIISILFSFLNALEKIKKSNVLFLLDDIFSYLDTRFIRNIIDRLNELKLQTWMTDVRSDSIHQIEKFKSKIHNINIDDNRFKVLNN
ncbi:MAG: DNA replication and repair protein RecF [Alphaproteobacteria bacterium]|nr:MAG: DNA replication and repair protein RecF [Alphaproteobacteria bacterium]